MKKTGQLAKRNLIGERIRKARLARKPPVTQDDLVGRLAARGITIDQTAVSRIENQTRYLMDYEIAAIARSLKVSVGWLFGETENRH
jgi:transcriptional regulator with XRE-family HTH domain